MGLADAVEGGCGVFRGEEDVVGELCGASGVGFFEESSGVACGSGEGFPEGLPGFGVDGIGGVGGGADLEEGAEELGGGGSAGEVAADPEEVFCGAAGEAEAVAGDLVGKGCVEGDFGSGGVAVGL